MADPVYSPDGKYMWTGDEWIPAPPTGPSAVTMQDSVIGGDVIHNKTVINNDVDAVTSAVISALERLGMVNKNESGSKLEQAIHVPSANESKSPIVVGAKVLVNWKNYGTYFPGKVASIEGEDSYVIHFDDGDVESSVPANRITVQPHSQANQDYIEQVTAEEQELIDSFAVFDENNSGTINSSKLFKILTEMGDPLDIEEAEELFTEMGIPLDSEINYKDLAKIMVQPFKPKPEVVMSDAEIVDGRLHGFGYRHQKLGDGLVNTTDILRIAYDNRATARVETRNTIYIVGPTGWKVRPDDHPFNKPEFTTGQQIKINWGNQWWDGLIREIHDNRYHVHYIGWDSSWDEWVDKSRIKSH